MNRLFSLGVALFSLMAYVFFAIAMFCLVVYGVKVSFGDAAATFVVAFGISSLISISSMITFKLLSK